MSEPAIIVSNVGKRFRLQHAASRTLKSCVLDFMRRRNSSRRDFWALKDVSFSVERGETLGIIGANGAGKSTLLALIAGTMKPATGRIEVKGSVSSLLELGAGFHPELSGRENVLLYGAIMGIGREKMKARFDSIVEFAELREWIDEPVKHYSSGMYVRLGFAVAVEVNPDIMLIDEVLAVGDTAFQRKCVERMKDFRERGKTMVIISHDLATIESNSDRVLFLEEGVVHGIGVPSGMVDAYRQFVREKEAARAKRVWGTREAVVTGVEVTNQDGLPEPLVSGGPVVIRIRYSTTRRIDRPVFGFAIADSNGRVVFGSNTQICGCDIPFIEGEGAMLLRIAPFTGARGMYLLSFSIHSEDHETNYCRQDNALEVRVECASNFEGCNMPCSWTREE